MSEKVLGFKEKDAIRTGTFVKDKITGRISDIGDFIEEEIVRQNKDRFEIYNCQIVSDDKLVPVVSLEWLEQWCKKNVTWTEKIMFMKLLSAAKKESGKR